MRHQLFFFIVFFASAILDNHPVNGQIPDSMRNSFVSPPDNARPRVYWWWLFNRVDREGITRDLEEFRAKGISGVNLICTGGYAGRAPLPGVKYQSAEWWELFRHAVKEAKRNNIELGFNLSAGGWTMQGPWVTKDHAMKKIVVSELKVDGPAVFSGKLPQPETVDEYYRDIRVQAFQLQGGTKNVDPLSIVDITSLLDAEGRIKWNVPDGKWIILRSGYTLTGHFWSKWFAYPGPPQADTFEGGEGYEIDYLSTAALNDHFEQLGKPVLEEIKKVDGRLAYLWSDSWECGKLTWTQNFDRQFLKLRGYDLMPYIPVFAGYTVTDTVVSSRFKEDFDKTIQDCIAENFYGNFMKLCHENGVKVGNEAGGPNDIPPIDALRNLGNCDIPAGEFWVNGHRNSDAGYNADIWQRLNLKQTATAAHIYGKREVMAEAFTMMDGDATHWALGPADLKPYANDAFCEGINRFMLHQATCQPPSDGKPGYEFCAGQHFTPNLTWWEQSPDFFAYLSRCQYMLQQGDFVADVCFYLGERAPTLAPPKYVIPSLGAGYDCDYSNADVLLNRMTVKDGRIVLPGGASYRLLVLQNCTSPLQEICDKVGSYQRLQVSSEPSSAMSLRVMEKLRDLILAGATVIGPPPRYTFGLESYPAGDEKLEAMVNEVWGDLDGRVRTVREFGKGRIIWGKTAREVLLADGIMPDFTFRGQESDPGRFDYIHRLCGDVDIYFVTNRTNQAVQGDFTFRTEGKSPEIWNPVTGKFARVNNVQQTATGTTLSLKMDRFESFFVIFHRPLAAGISRSSTQNFPEPVVSADLEGQWKVLFDPQWGGPDTITFPKLESWTDRPEEGIRYYSGKATYQKSFDLSSRADKYRRSGRRSGRLFIDLGEVRDVAEVRLNGKNLGVLWCYPWRVDITDAVKPTGNLLEVDVINLWANRVIGDLSQPVEKRYTKTHDGFRFDFLAPETRLLKSGLMGPVRFYRTDD